ncbi:unnamed protein product [Arabis nemorensis]|uniref:F-box domain-containing protein n=1 Tax=Arabis nemorensis TaxID=586526 RepID=A0A565BHJ5_9BRAS|nr:unnamed protein product [Arabis nemorensis]
MSLFFTKESISFFSDSSMEESVLSSDARGKGVLVDVVNIDDRISKLPNDLLLKILSALSTEEAVRTSILSKRWVDVWKDTSHLFLDMRKMAKFGSPLSVVAHRARSMTKVINDHRDHLERCTIYYYPYQLLLCENGMLESWIQSLVHVKHVNHLTLVNCRYNLKSPHAFNSCWNLKKLKLVGISAEIGVFNVVLLSCPSLEVLILDIKCHKTSGPLKIYNHNLKVLYLSSYQINGIEVSTPNLEIFIVRSLSCEMENFVIANPRLQFNKNYWTTGEIYPHASYYISCPHQEQKSVGHEFMVREASEYLTSYASMSVSVDLKNTKEVEVLKEVLAAWLGEMHELEILLKNNNACREEGESSIGRTENKFWEETKPFPNAFLRAYNVWLFNFSGSKEEFTLASRLITQGTVVKTLKIKPSSKCNKLEIEAIVAKLKELPKGHKELSIEMF